MREPCIVDVGADHVSAIIDFERFTQVCAQDCVRRQWNVLAILDLKHVPGRHRAAGDLLQAMGEELPVQRSLPRSALVQRLRQVRQVAAPSGEHCPQNLCAGLSAQHESLGMQLRGIEQQHAQDALVLLQYEARRAVHGLTRVGPRRRACISARFEASCQGELHLRVAAVGRIGQPQHVQQALEHVRRVVRPPYVRLGSARRARQPHVDFER